MADGTAVGVGVIAHQELVSAGIVSMISPRSDLKVVGRSCATSASAIRAWWLELKPEVLVATGPRALAALSICPDSGSSSRVVVLSAPGEDPAPPELVAAGAHAVLGVDASAQEIAMTVSLVARGHSVLRTALVPGVVRSLRSSASVPDLSGLTAREREILDDIAAGHSNGEIAVRRHVSVGTVKVHLRALKDKTGARSRANLTALAIRSVALVSP